MRQQPRGKGDDGFTLPEVLITVVMLGVMMTAITGALLVTIGPDQQAADRLVASHDGQLLALHLPQDLQSAGPTPADTDTAPGANLHPACTSVTGTNVLRLEWTQSVPPPLRTYAVSYRLADEDGERRLIRFDCSDEGAGFGPVSRLVVAHDLAHGSAATVKPEDPLFPSIISIEVTGRSGRVFTVSGSRRTPATSAP